MLYVKCVTFALCSLTLVECSCMSHTMQNGALSKQYRNDVNKIDRPNTTPTVRATCTFASTRLWFYYIITKIDPPFQNPGSAPEFRYLFLSLPLYLLIFLFAYFFLSLFLFLTLVIFISSLFLCVILFTFFLYFQSLSLSSFMLRR